MVGSSNLAPMLGSGVYPASVTPFDDRGRVDLAGVARLAAYFESGGCQGMVLAGTNGEGPSLSAVEKRDLVRDAAPFRGNLHLILGIATPSLHEAMWLTKQAAQAGGACLVMPPSYFRSVSQAGILDWFRTLLDNSPAPILIYNYPKMTGITLEPELFQMLGEHPQCAGLKDSSGEAANLVPFRQAMPVGKVLYVGDERLLLGALRAGWTGTISGAANVIAPWLDQIVRAWSEGKCDLAETRFQLCLPVIEAIRSLPQPAGNKALLAAARVIDRSDLRLPLTALDVTELTGVYQALGTLGLGQSLAMP